MPNPKKLIEVAMPVKEISAESMRDKSIRHGHISTLHLWWARRPLPVCRAIVFASLVPDPLDEECPQVFRDTVSFLLGPYENPGDPYKPYDDIPYTAAIDRMEDNLRNRLMMFIGRFSEGFCKNELKGKATSAAELLSDASLIKWDNKNNEAILNKARKLIWVANNSLNGKTCEELLSEFDRFYSAIKDSERELYNMMDRHLADPEITLKESQLANSIEAFLNRMPKVFDPFAGGGAIPLEAARLGCRSFGNDLNPVAHIIQKGSVEFPQKFGKPITFSTDEFISLYGLEKFNILPNEWKIFTGDHQLTSIKIPNRLSYDVENYSKELVGLAEAEIGYLYPADQHGNKPIAYYWARVGICSNPSCRAEVPLLKQFYLANTKSKQVFLKPIIGKSEISFEISYGKYEEHGWNSRGNLQCPCCGNITDVEKIKEQSINGNLKQRLLAVIFESESGKMYRLPTQDELDVISYVPKNNGFPTEKMQRNSAGGDTFSWGIQLWGQLFSTRQLYALLTLVAKLDEIKIKIYTEIKPTEYEYKKAVVTYLSILINRLAANLTQFGLWKPSGEFISSVFGRQAIPMVFDYPESNPFCNSTGSALNQIDWITRYIESESHIPFSTFLINASSGDKSQFPKKSLTAVVTDPPYYDAIAYADLSDFFYVWQKRTIGDLYPINFATPQTPKTEECTALKHHHNNSKDKAKEHFEEMLTRILDSIEYQTSDIVSIMFAHQSTDAWTSLCNSILNARMNITGSWSIDSEREVRNIALAGAALESSVTVSCRPSQRTGIADYKTIREEVLEVVSHDVEELYQLGFRGADLLTACFGQAVSVFGRYEKVEKADGSLVTIAELLDLAKESAFNALLKGFKGDDFTKFYIGWLQLYGLTESGFDDAAKFSRVGLNINVSELFTHSILIRSGNNQTLGTYSERNRLVHHLGEKGDSFLIDRVHKAMFLFKEAFRPILVQYVTEKAQSTDDPFWRVLTSLCEILPGGSDDHKQATGLLAIKENLIRESRNLSNIVSEPTFEF